MKQERLNEIYGVLFLLLGLFLLIGLLFHDAADHSFFALHPNDPVRNPTGVVGAFLSHYLVFTLGLSAFSVPFLILFWSSCFFLQKVPNQRLVELIGVITAVFSFSGILSLIVGAQSRVQTGGLLGYVIASTLERYFGLAGGLIIAMSCFLLAGLLFTDFLLYPAFQKIWDGLLEWFKSRAEKKAVRRSAKGEHIARIPKKRFFEEDRKTKLPDVPVKLKQYTPAADSEEKAERSRREEERERRLVLEKIKEKMEKEKIEKSQVHKREETEKTELPAPIHAERKQEAFTFPAVDILVAPPKSAVQFDTDYQRNSQILEETLADFGVEIKVMEVDQGPVVTRYEILPAPGVKVTRILSLSDDIALAMKAPSIRFIAPIPGKSAIGIEIPNSVIMRVCLRELIESKEYRQGKWKLPLALGKDTSGEPMVSDLTDMPHLLIAGTTGSGKTVCVNSLIAGLVYSRLPHELRFVMVDPKMVELAVYNKLPHMLTPVVTDVRKAAATLNWVVMEMEKRYRYFAQCGTRNIQAFNTRTSTPKSENPEEEIPEKLPYIVVVIDELADLMLVAQDKVEGAITRLAQLSRAVGIHLMLATQRPSVDVITGVIKANFPARISFKVASKIDSRTVLDMNGADKLIGKGDMLFLEPGREKPVRGQAPFVSDEEITAVVNAWNKQGEPQYEDEVAVAQDGKGALASGEKDELYDEAVQVVLEMGQASVSVLQRRLRLGYGRAARIIDMMEQAGIVGPWQGTKGREILIDKVKNSTEQEQEG